MSLCQCTKNHSPNTLAYQVHHIQPKSWGGPDVAANKITICGTTHDNVHTLLNLYVKYDGKPPAKEVSKYPRYVQNLALKAIESAGKVPHVYTLTHPESEVEYVNDD